MFNLVHPEDFGDKLIQDYLEAFGKYSIKNELYGKISLHVILGQVLCKNIYYRMGSREIDPRIHMLLIKPQGTGKGAGYSFVDKMARRLGIEFQSLTESTDAGLIGTTRTEGNQSVVVPGLLQTADILGMEEASVLFDYTSEFSKKNMTYMQITMNALEDSSCKIDKQLGGELIEFKPHASFLLMTYPPDRLVDKLLKTGFIDRVIPIFEDVTLQERLEVIKKMTENINVSTKESYLQYFESVAKRLEIIIKKYEKTKTCITIPDNIHGIMLPIIEEFAMKILDASPKAREKLEHFISRLYENLLKLAIHHALLCRREVVEVGDVLYARLTYMPIWRNLIISIESLLIISGEERMRHNRTIRTSIEVYNKILKQGKDPIVKGNVWVRRLSMLNELQGLWDNCSLETADNNLRKLEVLPEFEKSKMAQYEKDKFFKRRYIGTTAYLKKIKDIK